MSGSSPASPGGSQPRPLRLAARRYSGDIEQDGHRHQAFVEVFDWTDLTRNDWLVVNQFTVKGGKTVRPDMVAFVNGLPLAVIELKNPADEKKRMYSRRSIKFRTTRTRFRSFSSRT